MLAELLKTNVFFRSIAGSILILTFLVTVSFTHSAIAEDRHVSVYYYPWYAEPNVGHWKEGFLRSKLDPPMQPLLGMYSSQSGTVIRQHLTWSKQYAIDSWICSWWGPGSLEDSNLRNQVLPAIQGTATKFCVYYEAASLLGMNSEERIVLDQTAIDRFTGHMRYLAENYFQHPNYFKVEGRPVVHLYLSRCFTGDFATCGRAVRKEVRKYGLELYLVGDEIFWGSPNPSRIRQWDAITTYCMHGPEDFQGYPAESNLFSHMSIKYDEYGKVAKENGVTIIPNVFPGYSNRGSGKTNYAIPRSYAPGDTSTSTFEKMADWSEKYIDPELNMVCITSFNEWHEDTQVEPVVTASLKVRDSQTVEFLTQGFQYEAYGFKFLEAIVDKFGSSSGDRSAE